MSLFANESDTMPENAKQEVKQVAAERFVRRGEAFCREVFTQREACGIGVRAFCQQRGIAVSTFGLWRSKPLRRARVVQSFLLLGNGISWTSAGLARLKCTELAGLRQPSCVRG